LLSWLDTHPSSPTSSDLTEFTQVVNDIISTLSLPPTLCTPNHVQDFITQIEPADLSGVAAVVGGILGQDVLNALGGRELPVKNWLIFDGRSCFTPFKESLTVQAKARSTISWGRRMAHQKRRPEIAMHRASRIWIDMRIKKMSSDYSIYPSIPTEFSMHSHNICLNA
jgi:hypothetical protein